jgi:glycosyltransferase involved in cell wall biosynthesis
VKKIYIDGLGLVEGHFSGVGQYILGILRGMDEIIGNAKYNGQPYPDVTVIIPKGSRPKYLTFGFKHLKFKTFPMSFRVMSALWYRGKMPPIDLICGRGTYIFPRFVDMPLAYSKSILVIFDLSYEHYRQYSDEKNAIFLSKGVRRSVKNASKVIGISKNAKREIEEFYEQPKDSVAVSTPAADPRYLYKRSPREVERVKNKYGIAGDYILSLSNLEPRKNLGALVEAYCRLPKDARDKNALLLVGVNGWKTEEMFKDIVERVDKGYNIIRPSQYVLDEDKPAIISGASLLVYPSHYEGFGMPPLEALSCGVPVITSDNSSLPEVVGDAGKMVSSLDTDALHKAIRDSLENIVALKKKATSEGPARAAEFSWVKSAQVFLDAAAEVEA